MVLNLLISVILAAFSKEQIYHEVNIYFLFNRPTAYQGNCGGQSNNIVSHPSYPNKLLVCFCPLYSKLQGVFNLSAPTCMWMDVRGVGV